MPLSLVQGGSLAPTHIEPDHGPQRVGLDLGGFFALARAGIDYQLIKFREAGLKQSAGSVEQFI